MVMQVNPGTGTGQMIIDTEPDFDPEPEANPEPQNNPEPEAKVDVDPKIEAGKNQRATPAQDTIFK